MRYIQIIFIFLMVLALSGCLQKPQMQEVIPDTPQDIQVEEDEENVVPEEENTVDPSDENTNTLDTSIEASGSISSTGTTQDEQEIIAEYEQELESLFNDILGDDKK